MRTNVSRWIGGTLAAFLGVGLVRLLAPAFTGFTGSLTAAAGYVLVVIGIMVIARAAKPNYSADRLATEKETNG